MSAAEAEVSGPVSTAASNRAASNQAPSNQAPSKPTAALVLRSSMRLLAAEVRLIMGRRRNQAGISVLVLVPVIMAVAIKMTASDSTRGGDFLSQITSNGLFVPFAAFTVEITMFLPLAIALLSGDSIAGEANQGTLRYLLTVPVSRTRLLLVKFLSLMVGAAIGVGAIAVVGGVLGVALFGAGPMQTFSGVQIDTGQALVRLLIACGYIVLCMSALAAVGLFISTLTEQPIAAAIAVMIFTIVSWILSGVPQLDWLHPWLLVTYWPSFADVMYQPIVTSRMLHGLGVSAAYVFVFGASAWAYFSAKDVTS